MNVYLNLNKKFDYNKFFQQFIFNKFIYYTYFNKYYI